MKASVFKKNRKGLKSPWCVRWKFFNGSKWVLKEKHFRTKPLALEFKQLKDADMSAGGLDLSPIERETIKFVVSQCRAASLELADVMSAGLKVLRPSAGINAPDLAFAVECFLGTCAARGLRSATLCNYETTLKAWMRYVGPTALVSEITPENTIKYIVLKGKKESSRRNVRACVSAFWSYASLEGWVPPLARGALSWVAIRSDAVEPVVYSVKQAQDLLNAIDPALRPALAIALFAGVRPTGLMRLKWTQVIDGSTFGINFESKTIKLHSSWVKTRAGRTLQSLPDNLWWWINKYYEESALLSVSTNRVNYVCPVSQSKWYSELSKAHKEIGFDVKGANDVARHSFGSYGRHRGLDWVIATLGHAGGMRVFDRHYNNSAATEEQSRAYFSIAP